MVYFKGESGAEWQYDPNDGIGERGGFGEVFRGTGPQGNPVAIKRVPLRWGDEAERRRREREVEIARILSASPARHLMTTLDIARVDDDLLLVMPLADRSLSAALKARDLDISARIQALLDITQGLIELAAVAVLHRDLKPANVLRSDHRWQLADFGIARSLIEETGTFTFLGAGSMPYMAPELWNGQPATYKSDLYALGVIAYEALTGTRPFQGPGQEDLRRQHLQQAPPELTDVAPATGRLILRLLAKNPAERPQGAGAVAETLNAALKQLNPLQEGLREAAYRVERRRGHRVARRAALTAGDQAQQQKRTQAVADLDSLLHDAADLATEALPEILLHHPKDLSWSLSWETIGLVIRLWDSAPPQQPGPGTLIHAGAIYQISSPAPVANLVCEQLNDQLIWSTLNFTAAGSTSGAQERGLEYQEFLTYALRRPRPASPTRSTLTPDTIIKLLATSLDQS